MTVFNELEIVFEKLNRQLFFFQWTIILNKCNIGKKRSLTPITDNKDAADLIGNGRFEIPEPMEKERGGLGRGTKQMHNNTVQKLSLIMKK